MRFSGEHHTRYDYTDAVFLEPHVIRLRPRADPAQIVRSYAIEIKPEPAGLTEGIDAWGNETTWTWFSGTHESLEITTRFDVETTRHNPFDFVLPTSEASILPVPYAAAERTALDAYLRRDGESAAVATLADDVAHAAGGRIMEFAIELVARLHDRCEMIVRPEGDPFPAEETLASGRGSCRDITIVYIEACRRAGVAARFVSGYVEHVPEGQDPELHAWAEVYVPGGGWRAFDPSQGLAVSTGHVALAAAATPAGAAPVTGSFRAKGRASSKLTTTIELDIEP